MFLGCLFCSTRELERAAVGEGGRSASVRRSERVAVGENRPSELLRYGVVWRWENDPVPYPEALKLMHERAREVRTGTKKELVWFLEHPDLYTSGARGRPEELLDSQRCSVFASNRGGGYTWHGPGQRVVYLMLDLQAREADIRRFVWRIEEWAKTALGLLGVGVGRQDQGRGLWTDVGAGETAKIVSVGLRLKRWVSLHGFSVNVSPDLDQFSGIVACGQPTTKATSLQALGRRISMHALDAALLRSFPHVFGHDLRSCPLLPGLPGTPGLSGP